MALFDRIMWSIIECQATVQLRVKCYSKVRQTVCGGPNPCVGRTDNELSCLGRRATELLDGRRLFFLLNYSPCHESRPTVTSLVYPVRCCHICFVLLADTVSCKLAFDPTWLGKCIKCNRESSRILGFYSGGYEEYHHLGYDAVFLRNVGCNSTDCTASYPRR
jgi:hypothetical protein